MLGAGIATIATDKAPKAIGAYSQGKIVPSSANLIYTSGSIGINPATGELISEDVKEQTIQAMDNLREILVAANSSFDQVVKATIFITDMANFQTVNTEYAKYFKNGFPARSCVGVAQLPKNAKVEVEVIAVQNEEKK